MRLKMKQEKTEKKIYEETNKRYEIHFTIFDQNLRDFSTLAIIHASDPSTRSS